MLPIISEGSVDDYKEFLERYSKLLHPNHYHMLTAKHSLMQMMGRTEGYLIQDMSDEMVNIFSVKIHLSIINVKTENTYYIYKPLCKNNFLHENEFRLILIVLEIKIITISGSKALNNLNSTVKNVFIAYF